jgi:hypothetical protein
MDEMLKDKARSWRERDPDTFDRAARDLAAGREPTIPAEHLGEVLATKGVYGRPAVDAAVLAVYVESSYGAHW